MIFAYNDKHVNLFYLIFSYIQDEIVQILKGLDDSLSLDYKNRWTDIERHVTQDIIPVVKRVLGDRFQYTDIELKKVLQNLHRHRRDAYNISKNPLKLKVNKRRTGTNTRRKDVSISFILIY